MGSATSPSLRVRPATAADAHVLGELGASLVRTHHEFDRTRFLPPSVDTARGYSSYLVSQMGREDVILLVAEEGGVVLGYSYAEIEGVDYMSLRGPAGVLHDIVVDQEHRGRGVGRMLLESTLRAIEAHGVPQTVLSAAAGNESARRLFASAGFRDTMREMTRDRPDGAAAETRDLPSREASGDLASFKRALLADETARVARHDYLAYHRKRFQYVLDVCKRYVPSRTAAVMDVGPSQLSRSLAAYYDDVTTLGFKSGEWAHERSLDGGEPTRHVEFDLDEVVMGRTPEALRQYDLVVFAETLEHLHAAPELVLRMLRDLMRPGATLVCQTPNAAALHKRVRLLFGRHPYERIRIDERNPGHFREYTKRELIELSGVAGLEVVSHEYAEYFGRPESGGAAGRLAFAVYRWIGAAVPSLRRGQTLVARRP